MEREISIIIIDDSESSSNVIQEFIKIISKENPNSLFLIKSVDSRIAAKKEIERHRPNLILSDHRLSGDYGLDVLRQFKNEGLIDYKVQCSIYSTDGAIVSALEPKDKIFVLKSITKAEIEIVLNKMCSRLECCDMKNLFDLPISLNLDQALYFEGVKEGTYIHYLTKEGEFDTRLSNVKLSAKLDQILDFEFFIQYHAFKIANINYYKEVKIDKDNQSEQFLAASIKSIPNYWKKRNGNAREINHSRLLITDRFIDSIRKKLS